MLEIVFSIALIGSFLLLCVLAIKDLKSVADYRKKEYQRRETIKKTLLDISKYLEIIAEHYVLKDIK